MNELALFAGAGGGILGGKLLGWRTVCAVEWEPYPASVLVARQNDGILPPFPIWDDVQTFDGKPWRGIVDVVSGGFPCQDISAAGRGAGIDGERSGMWREMARIIHEVRPRFAFVENSPMLTSRGLGTVLGDLAEMGFDAKWGVLGAADVGANHQRDRIWIVARNVANSVFTWEWRDKWEGKIKKNVDANSNSVNDALRGNDKNYEEKLVKWGNEFRGSFNNSGERYKESARESKGLADTTSIRQQKSGKYEQSISSKKGCDWKANYVESIGSSNFWGIEPNVGRVADGVAARVDRLKAIGNGQVPLCAAEAWRILSA